MTKSTSQTSEKPRPTSRGLWSWLKVNSNRTLLTWIGTGLVVVVGALWSAYLHFSTPPDPKSKTTSARQEINKDAEVSGSNPPPTIQQRAEAGKEGTAINVGRDVNINK